MAGVYKDSFNIQMLVLDKKNIANNRLDLLVLKLVPRNNSVGGLSFDRGRIEKTVEILRSHFFEQLLVDIKVCVHVLHIVMLFE